MSRPRKKRCVYKNPKAVFFKPQGIPMRHLETVVLPLEGFEAIRLVDSENMKQQEAARLMEISRPTFSRVLNQARKVVAEAITKGRAIQIEGGDYRMVSEKPQNLK